MNQFEHMTLGQCFNTDRSDFIVNDAAMWNKPGVRCRDIVKMIKPKFFISSRSDCLRIQKESK